MKTTRYFNLTRQRPDRAWIKEAWIERVLTAPEHEQAQSNGRFRFWATIPAAGGRSLRVVTLAGRITVHNAFFDRRAPR